MLEGIVEQHQGLVVGLQRLHVVDAFFPGFEVLGVAFEELDQTRVCVFMALHFFQNGGHHQQSVFVVRVEQQGLRKVLQGGGVVLTKSSCLRVMYCTFFPFIFLYLCAHDSSAVVLARTVGVYILK